jgi:hypothetical protein
LIKGLIYVNKFRQVPKKQFCLKQLHNMFDENHFVGKLTVPLVYFKGFEYYAVEKEKFTKMLSSKDLISTEFSFGRTSQKT